VREGKGNMDNRQLKEIILAQVRMEDVVMRYTPREIRHHRCRCRIHGGEHMNMQLYENSFHCFVCGKGGNLIDYVCETMNIPFNDALAKIASDFGFGDLLGRKKKTGLVDVQAAADKLARQREDRKKIRDITESYYLLWYERSAENKEIIRTAPKDSEEFWQALHDDPYLDYRFSVAEDLLNELNEKGPTDPGFLESFRKELKDIWEMT